MGLMGYIDKVEFEALAAIVDPWTYRDRLTVCSERQREKALVLYY
jgi:hypothetical protein